MQVYLCLIFSPMELGGKGQLCWVHLPLLSSLDRRVDSGLDWRGDAEKVTSALLCNWMFKGCHKYGPAVITGFNLNSITITL